MITGPDKIQIFNDQREEFKHLLKSRESIVDHITFDSDYAENLYQQVAIQAQIESNGMSDEVIDTRERLLIELNLHVLKAVFEHSDKRVVQLRHITRLIPEFFTEYLTDNQRTAITELHVSGAHIKQIPDVISTLGNLKTLFLNRNEIKILPKTLGQLPSLVNLNLSDNEITEIDDSILRLPNLHWLAVTNNRISDNESQRIAKALQARQIDFEDNTPNRATSKRQ